ncbi:MAG TPA: HAMP domain-containing sensor histidine kinase, partial [Flavobacterium sp.]|nr:HAMP domain-containing sensor histidine kinase [Flavobacterium sp.]
VRYCLRELDRLNVLVDQLLMLARYESRQHPVSIQPVTVNALFYDVTARHSALIAQKKLRIDYRIDPNLTLETDEFLLSSILDNLIENAVKYSLDGQSIVLEAAQDGACTRFVIQDSGIGIPEQDLDKIFLPFFRSRTTHQETSGTGIGLSIVARLCNLLGGEILAFSKPNKGTRIEVSLPLHQ